MGFRLIQRSLEPLALRTNEILMMLRDSNSEADSCILIMVVVVVVVVAVVVLGHRHLGTRAYLKHSEPGSYHIPKTH